MYNDPQMRTEPTDDGFIVVCPFCGEQIAPWEETREDMHIECWLTDDEITRNGGGYENA